MSVKAERLAGAGCSPGCCASWLGLCWVGGGGWKRRDGHRPGQQHGMGFASQSGEGARGGLQAQIGFSRGFPGNEAGLAGRGAFGLGQDHADELPPEQRYW